MEYASQVFTPLLIIAAGLAVRWWMYKLDCARIRENVAEHGGSVVAITYQLFRWGWGSTRVYDVQYTTHAGRTVSATCATSMFAGVHWLQSEPPDSSAIEDVSTTSPGR